MLQKDKPYECIMDGTKQNRGSWGETKWLNWYSHCRDGEQRSASCDSQKVPFSFCMNTQYFILWLYKLKTKHFLLYRMETLGLYITTHSECAPCAPAQTHTTDVCAHFLCLCCRSSSLCGCYRSHLSLALCFIPFLPHQIADRFYSSSVPGKPPAPPAPTSTHTHTQHKT